jgi:ABC-type amino acid transport substrate-binding protein
MPYRESQRLSPSDPGPAGTWWRSARATALRRARRRPGRTGCLLLVLLIATLWVLSRAIDEVTAGVTAGVTALFTDHPAPVAGKPFDTPTPARPARSGSPTIDRIALRGKLIAAIQEAPGLAQRSPDSGDYTGFDIALLGLLARELGVDPAHTTLKPLSASSREAALGRAEVDLVLGDYEITAARRAQLGVAGPYLVRPLRLAVPATSPVTGLGSLGRGEVCAPEDSPAAAALAKGGVRLQTRASLDECAHLLGDGVEAIAADQDALAALLSQQPDTLRMVGAPLGSTEYGIGLPPGDPLLRDRVTAVLRHAIADGTWARLYAQYLGTPVPDPPVLH